MNERRYSSEGFKPEAFKALIDYFKEQRINILRDELRQVTGWEGSIAYEEDEEDGEIFMFMTEDGDPISKISLAVAGIFHTAIEERGIENVKEIYERC